MPQVSRHSFLLVLLVLVLNVDDDGDAAVLERIRPRGLTVNFDWGGVVMVSVATTDGGEDGEAIMLAMLLGAAAAASGYCSWE